MVGINGRALVFLGNVDEVSWLLYVEVVALAVVEVVNPSNGCKICEAAVEGSAIVEYVAGVLAEAGAGIEVRVGVGTGIEVEVGVSVIDTAGPFTDTLGMVGYAVWLGFPFFQFCLLHLSLG